MVGYSADSRVPLSVEFGTGSSRSKPPKLQGLQPKRRQRNLEMVLQLALPRRLILRRRSMHLLEEKLQEAQVEEVAPKVEGGWLCQRPRAGPATLSRLLLLVVLAT